MKDDKSRILPLLMDPRQPDENNRAYAYRTSSCSPAAS